MFDRLLSECGRWLSALAITILCVFTPNAGVLGDDWEKKTPPTMDDMTSATAQAAPDGTTANTRVTIGLGEIVTCTIPSATWKNTDYNKTTGKDVEDTIGNRVWACSAGGSISATAVTSDTTTMTADKSEGTPEVSVDVFDSKTRFVDDKITKKKKFTVIKPSGETTRDHGWSLGGAGCTAQFESTLNPKTVCFSRITVTEKNGAGSADGCWFVGSTQAKFNALTGGTWSVSTANVWGDDNLSWGTANITYYRANPVGAVRAPCSTTLAQEMHVVEGTSGKYASGNLVLTIGVANVTCVRNGVTMTNPYP